jgi:RIO kinase 1
MEFFGNAEGAAPLLERCDLDDREARRVFHRLLDNVECMLACDLVHGDLSAYNVLYWRGRAWIIDMPQAVDARRNSNARELLERDIHNLTRYFRCHGIRDDSATRAQRLWSQYERGQL